MGAGRIIVSTPRHLVKRFLKEEYNSASDMYASKWERDIHKVIPSSFGSKSDTL